jgi:hypothetical protein
MCKKEAFLKGLHPPRVSTLLCELKVKVRSASMARVAPGVICLYLVRFVTKILNVLDDASETLHRVELLRVRLSPLHRTQQYLEEHLGPAKGKGCNKRGSTSNPIWKRW